MKHALCAAIAAFGVAAGPALAADRYELDPAHTHVQFSVERFGFNDIIGYFPGVAGVVTLDRDAPENSAVEAEISVASLESGDETRNAHVTGGSWLDAAEFATIAFKSTGVETTAENAARVTGDLTVLGETRAVTLDVTLNKLGTDPATKRMAAGFSATTVLKRSEFGLTTAGALVGDDVAVRIEVLAHKSEE